MKTVGILLLTVWASRAVGWTLPWFGVSFSEYTPGEDWRSPAPAGARFFRVEVSLPTGL